MKFTLVIFLTLSLLACTFGYDDDPRSKGLTDRIEKVARQQNQLEQDVDRQITGLEGLIRNLTIQIQSLEYKINNNQNDLLEDIQNNGLKIGKSWVIREEHPINSTGSYNTLVFRDQSTLSKDSRYAMWQDQYVDLYSK